MLAVLSVQPSQHANKTPDTDTTTLQPDQTKTLLPLPLSSQHNTVYYHCLTTPIQTSREVAWQYLVARVRHRFKYDQYVSLLPLRVLGLASTATTATYNDTTLNNVVFLLLTPRIQRTPQLETILCFLP